MSLTPLPTPPTRNDPANFAARADAFMSALPNFVTELDELSPIASVKDDILAIANYKGLWTDLTGALAIPAGTYHAGYFWTLTEDIADVTAAEPGVSSSWQRPVVSSIVTVIDDDVVGAIKYSPTAPGDKWLKCDGSSYLQADYPDLFALTGLIPTGLPEYVLATCPSAGVYGLASVGDTFYLWGGDGQWYSKTGTSWTSITAFAASNYPANECNGRIVTMRGATCWYSSDECVTWSSSTLPFSTPSAACKYVGGKYFVANSSGSTYLAVSDDLVTWTACTGLTTYPKNVIYTAKSTYPSDDIIYNNGVWLLRPNTGNNTLWKSTDGIAWSSVSPGTKSDAVVEGICAAGDYFWAWSASSGSSPNYTGYLCRSADGSSWSNVYPWPIGNTPSNKLYRWVSFDSGRYYALSAQNTAYACPIASDDGSTWSELPSTYVSTGNYGKTNPVTCNNGVYLGVGNYASSTAPVRFASIVDGICSGPEYVHNGQLTTTTALFEEGETSWDGVNALMGNMIVYVPRYGTSCRTWWRTATADFNAGYVKNVMPLASWTAADIRSAVTDSRLMLAVNNSGWKVYVTGSVFGYNHATEFAVPLISSPIPGVSAYIKAEA